MGNEHHGIDEYVPPKITDHDRHRARFAEKQEQDRDLTAFVYGFDGELIEVPLLRPSSAKSIARREVEDARRAGEFYAEQIARLDRTREHIETIHDTFQSAVGALLAILKGIPVSEPSGPRRILPPLPIVEEPK